MQRFFIGAFCLTLVMTSALADGNRYTPNAHNTPGWRPLNPSAADQPPVAGSPHDAPVRYRPKNYNQPEPPPDNRAVPDNQSYGAAPGYGNVAEPPPYGYYYDAPDNYSQPPYPYPQATYPGEWGYSSYPGYNPMPAYGYPYPTEPAPGYSPYAAPPDYGYWPDYGGGYYGPSASEPGFGTGGDYPGYGNSGYDNSHGAPSQAPAQGYPGAPSGYAAPEGEPAAGYPAYGYEQSPGYPAAGQPTPNNPSTPAWSPQASAPEAARNPATNHAPAAAAGRPTDSYRINGSTAVFRPWTDPDEESAPQQPGQ